MALGSSAAAPVTWGLLPDTAALNRRGNLLVGGVDIVRLAERVGTPVYLYDEATLRARASAASRSWPAGASYAAKAFLCRAMARLVVDEGLGIDVASAGELATALAAGVDPGLITLHGNNKSEAELSQALASGIARIVVDSFDEIDRLERLVVKADAAPIRVWLRVTPGIAAPTHTAVATGHSDSKFGFSLAGGLAERAAERLRASTRLWLTGVHGHIGSQILDLRSFELEARILSRFARAHQLEEVCVGGGLGVPTNSAEIAPSLADWAETVQAACRQVGLAPARQCLAEPGRAIAATAGMTIYRVGAIKRLASGLIDVAVDGGMSDNPRPALYGSRYEAFLPREPTAARPLQVSVVGKHCESGDVLIRDGSLPADIRVGDLLAVPVTGAYCHSMASTYNRIPRPPVLFLRDGRARVVVRRETIRDLLRLDR